MLLNATYLANGLARRAIAYLVAMRTPTYVPAVSDAELARRAKRLELNHRLICDIRDVRAYSARQGLLYCPEPAGEFIHGVNRPDELIARSARQLAATLVTDDIELITECRALGIDAVQPWEVARSYSGSGELPGISKICRYLAPSPDCGYIFARVEPGAWAGGQVKDGTFTVTDCGSSVRLYYLAAETCWVFSVIGVGEAKLVMPVLPETHYVVCGQYALEAGNHRLTLQAARAGERPAFFRKFVRGIATLAWQEMSVGHALSGQDHWWGDVKDLVVADGRIKPASFTRMAATEDLAPNPHDGGRLEEELIRASLIIVPG